MAKKKTSLARSQADKLLAEVTSGIEDIRDVDLNIDTLLENAGIGRGVLGDDVSSADMLEELRSKNKFIRSTISLIKQLKKNKADLDALTKPEIRAVTQTGRGPSLAYAINTQLGINRRRLRAGDIMTLAEQRAQEFVGPIASPEQIDDGLRADRERRRNHYNYLRKQVSERRAERKERNRQQAAWNLFNMSDKDRFLKEAQERFGTPERAEEAYKKELKKNLPAFFKESKANTKNLERMSKVFSYARGIPGLGGITSMGPVGAGVALGTAAIATTTGIFNQIDKANASVVRWENATRFYGAPSEEERRTMFLAGIGDPAKQSEIYGKLTARFGSFQNAMRVFSQFDKMPDGIAKIMALQSMTGEGLTPETLAMAGIQAGTLTPSSARKMAGALDVQRIATQLGIKSGSKENAAIQAGLMFMPDSWLARMGSVGDIFEGQNLDKINQAKEIANTGIRYDSQGAVNNSVSNITNGDTIYNNYITVPDTGQIGPAIESATDGSRRAVDRQKKMDAVATGVLQ